MIGDVQPRILMYNLDFDLDEKFQDVNCGPVALCRPTQNPCVNFRAKAVTHEEICHFVVA